MNDEPAGWEHVERCLAILDELEAAVFALPGAAQTRAISERDRLGEAHGDDLLCGCWAAAEEATALLELMGRHIAALVQLARLHPGFFTPAHTLSRAVIEHGLRLQWLLEPRDAPEREERWIALKREELRLYKQMPQVDTASIAEMERRIAAVVEHTGRPGDKGTPSAQALADKFSRGGRIYSLYRWMSQATHGSVVGAGTFHVENRLDWMRHGGQGEWIESEFWAMPIAATWEAATGAARAYRDLLCPEEELVVLRSAQDMASARSLIPANYQARVSMERTQVRPSREPQVPLNRAERRAAARRRKRR